MARILDQFDLGVNNNQFAVAVAAVCNDAKKNKRQFVSVPSGMGKSRIILAAIALRKLFYSTNFFTVVFTSELLKSVDAKSYELAAVALGIDLNMIVYKSEQTLESQIRSNTDYVVIDEAD